MSSNPLQQASTALQSHVDQVEKLELSGSASNLNSVLYGSSLKRGSNCHIFVLTANGEFAANANSTQLMVHGVTDPASSQEGERAEYLYGVCVTLKELTIMVK